MDARQRGSISASPSFFRYASQSGSGGGGGGGQQQQQLNGTGGPLRSPVDAQRDDFWTHHDMSVQSNHSRQMERWA